MVHLKRFSAITLLAILFVKSTCFKTKKFTLNFSFILFMFFGTGFQFLNAQVVYVTPTGAGSMNGTSWTNAFDYYSFKVTVPTAAYGTQYWVKAGTYDISTYSPTHNLTIPNGVKLFGGFAGTETILSQRNWQNNVTKIIASNSSYNVIEIGKVDSNTIIDGFTINNGSTATSYAVNNVIHILADTTNVKINNCSISNNYTYRYGAVYIEGPMTQYTHACKPFFTNCNFSYNKVYIYGGGAVNVNYASPNFTNCTFNYDSSSRVHTDGSEQGGAINFAGLCHSVFNNCAFSNNWALVDGGAIYSNFLGGSSNVGALFFYNCNFNFNITGGAGGAVKKTSKWDTTTFVKCNFNLNNAHDGGAISLGANNAIINCSFTNNKALYNGGAIVYSPSIVSFPDRDSLLIINCVFSNNSTQSQTQTSYGGGAIYYYNNFYSSGNGDLYYGGGVRIYNSTFATDSSNRGGVMYFCQNSPQYPKFYNCVFWGNSTSQVYYCDLSSYISLDNCIVQGGASSVDGNGTHGTNNSSSNPLFANLLNPNGADSIIRTYDDGLIPLAGSPAIDLGSNSFLVPGINTDFLGGPRVINSLVDRGAYENAGPHIFNIDSTSLNTIYCAGDSIRITFIFSPSAYIGNIFTAQLSDASGSFNNLVNLGSSVGIGNGTINGMIPSNVSFGSGYRIRIVSSFPYLISNNNGFNISINAKPRAGFTINNSSQCFGGNNFLFTDTSSIGTGSLTRFWNFGTGSNDTSSSVNPNKTYSNIGAYNVKLISNNGGCKDSIVKSINVNNKPNVGFTINNPTQCINGNVFIFNDTSNVTSGTLTRIWNFGNGANDTSSSINPNKVYSSYGTFNVKLISGNNGCKDSLTKMVIVNPKPIVGFTTNTFAQCYNFSFNDTSKISSGTLTRKWNFGEGISDTSTNINPLKIYTFLGIDTVKLVATSNFGCKDSLSKTVTVYPKPKVGFVMNKSSQCLISNNFFFQDTSRINSGSMSRKWNLGTGISDTSIYPFVNKIYTIANIYSIKLVVTSNYGCMDSITQTISVNPKPSVGFTINNSTQCVNGNIFSFNDTSSVGNGTSTSLWNFGSGTSDTSSLKSPNKIYSNANSYSIKLISISNNNCKDSITKTITVNTKPNVGFTQNNLSQCLTGNNFLFNDTSTISSGTITRTWNFGDGATSTSSVAGKSYLVSGTYNVNLVIASNNNCKDSITKVVTVYPQPKSGFTINNTSQCLIGNNFSFDDTTSGTNTRLWYLGDLTTNTNDTFSKTYASAGTFYVKLKVTDSHNCIDSFTKTLTVKPNPAQPTIIALTKSLLQSSVANSYQWYLSSNAITGATSQTLTLTSNGIYTVKIDSTNGCSNLSNSYTALSVGVNEINNLGEIKIYPNPATNELHIESGSSEKLYVQLFDVTGKLILQDSFIQHLSFNIQHCLPGIYFLRITDTNNGIVKTQKVVVMK